MSEQTPDHENPENIDEAEDKPVVDDPHTAPRDREIRLPLSTKVDGVLTRKVVLRRTTGFEDDLLRDESGGDKARMARVSQVLSQCTVQMGDKRRTGDTGDNHKDDQMLFFEEYQAMSTPSRAFSWVKLRQLSHGHVFKFGATCACKKHNDGITVDLRDAKVTEATDEFCAEEVHTYSGDGHSVEWQVLSGAKEYTLQQLRKANPGNLDSAEIFPFIVRLDGKKINGIVDLLPLSGEFRAALRDQFSVGGMDLVSLNTCKHCGREFATMLPIYNKSFFSPGGK